MLCFPDGHEKIGGRKKVGGGLTIQKILLFKLQ
jgi:hypothetical protein